MPFFYEPHITKATTVVVLDEAASKHIVQVLRMQKGESLQLTNGSGLLLDAVISDDHRKRCTVQVRSAAEHPVPASRIIVAISPVKSAARWEWFLEKATEIGVHTIIPLLCSRTEKNNFRTARLQGILISAMLQSQQTWLPELHEPVKLSGWLPGVVAAQKFIAHCVDGADKQALSAIHLIPSKDRVILIGPEGDFTPEEIQLAISADYIPVSLGHTRLRTETAGIVAATLLTGSR